MLDEIDIRSLVIVLPVHRVTNVRGQFDLLLAKGNGLK